MSDVVNRAAEAATKITELQKERTALEESALAHEAAARSDRLKMTECKKQIAEWTTALNSLNVQRSVETAQQAATKAQESAQANEKKTADTLAECEKMKTELAEMLAKAKQAEKPPEVKPE